MGFRHDFLQLPLARSAASRVRDQLINTINFQKKIQIRDNAKVIQGATKSVKCHGNNLLHHLRIINIKLSSFKVPIKIVSENTKQPAADAYRGHVHMTSAIFLGSQTS